MTCPKCGFEFEGNFCSNCGERATLEVTAPIPPLSQPYLLEIGNKEVDVNLIIRMCGLGIRKSGSYYQLSKSTGIPQDEARRILDPIIEHHIQSGEKINIFQGAVAQTQFESAERKQNQSDAKDKALSKHERIKENKKNGVACCPKCGSTSLSANNQGIGIGKAAVGVWALGPIGAAAGAIGAKKTQVTCLNCGHKWKL